MQPNEGPVDSVWFLATYLGKWVVIGGVVAGLSPARSRSCG
jgi:hypothetical protein